MIVMNHGCRSVALAVIFCATCLLQAEKSLSDLAEAVRPAIVTLLVYNPDRALPSFGTGFLLAPDQVVSARHALAGGTRAEICTTDGDFIVVQGLLAEDRMRDLSVLKLARPVARARLLKLSNTRLRAGDAVFTIGAPLGLEWTLSAGIISAVRTLPEVGCLYQHTVQISPGNSGGPLLSWRGEVIGLQISTIKDGQTLNFAMPAEHIAALKPGKVIALAEAAKEVGTKFISEINARIDRTSLRPIQREDFPGFIPFTEAAVRRQPEEPDTWFRLGLILELSGKLDLAATNYLKTIAMQPKHPLALNNLGAIYNRQSRHAEAREVLREAAALKPDLACAWDNLACALIGLKLGREAVESAEKAVQLNRENKDYVFNLGRAYHLNGDPDKTRQQCQRLDLMDARLATKLKELLNTKRASEGK